MATLRFCRRGADPEAVRAEFVAFADQDPNRSTRATILAWRALGNSVATGTARDWLAASDGPWKQAAKARAARAVTRRHEARYAPTRGMRQAIKERKRAEFIAFADANPMVSFEGLIELYRDEGGRVCSAQAAGWLRGSTGPWKDAEPERRKLGGKKSGASRTGRIAAACTTEDDAAFVAFANARKTLSNRAVVDAWRKEGHSIGTAHADALLVGTEWAAAQPDRLARRGANMRGEMRPTIPSKAFTSEHGPPPDRRPAIDPHDLAAVCRRYVVEWRKVRRGWGRPSLETYQAVNEAMRARARLTTTAGREYRDRKAVGA